LEKILSPNNATENLPKILEEAKSDKRFAYLSALVVDATDTGHWDVFRFMQKHILHLGAVSVASLLDAAGFGDVKAVYEVLTPKFDYSKLSPDFIGVSAIISNIPFANKKIAYFRTQNPNALIIAGGSGYFFSPEIALNNGADAVVIGKCEYALMNLLNFLHENKNTGESLRSAFQRLKPNDIQGVYTGENEIAPAPLVDMDEAPEVNFRLIHGRTSRFVRTLMSSYGCTVRDCDFCSAHVLNSRKYKYNSTKAIIKKMWDAQKEGVKGIFFGDDHMFGRGWQNIKELAIALINEKKKGLKMKISCQATIGSIYDNLSNKIVDLLESAGFVAFFFGVESTHDDDLEEMNASKKTSNKKAAAVFDALKGRMDSHAMCVLKPFVKKEDREKAPYSVVDSPEEIKGYRKKVMAMVDFLKKHGVRTAQFHSAVPLPGSGITKKFFDAGIVLKKVGGKYVDWSKYTGQYVVASSNPLESNRIMEDAYRRFYSAGSMAAAVARGVFAIPSYRKIRNAAASFFWKFGARCIMVGHCNTRATKNYIKSLKNGDFEFYKPGEAFVPC